MTTRHLNAARTGSARPASADAYHIAFKDGLYRVYDKAGRFRLGFATLPAAQAYIAGRTAPASHNNALSDEGMKVAA